MTIVVVGGHARNVGKTLVTTAVIRAFQRCTWTAVKISHWHGYDAAARESDEGRLFRIYEEQDIRGASDTSRFLAAGASRALWLQVGKNGLSAAGDFLTSILCSTPFVIIESNAILKLLDPDICIFVLRFDVGDFKDSAYELLKRADVAVAMGCLSSSPGWRKTVTEALRTVPLFAAEEPGIVPQGFVEWIKARLGRSQARTPF